MRRALLSLCVAVCGVGLLWLASPALSLKPHVPRAVDFELPVATPSGATAAAAGWTSPVLRAPKRFDLLGLRWRGGAEEVHAELRVRRSGGRWSGWTEAADAHDHGPDSAPAVRGTDPVWAGGADELQLRLARRVRGLRVHFVNATGTATPVQRRVTRARTAVADAARWALADEPATAAGEQPTIVPRADWGADQCAPRDAPAQGQVQMAFVHHTVNANEYGPEDSRALVLGICRYHRNSNGWDDIGYNFLVDRYGTIFEGRAGGIDQAVVGAQAQGYNAVSTGVANLGTFESAGQSDAALGSIARLLAWKLPLHGVPVTGSVTVRSAGGSTNRHPSGRDVTFERISGHRDGNSTSCPGSALYAQLPRLRGLAASRAPDVVAPTPPPSQAVGVRLSLTAAVRRLTFPAPAALSGRMTDRAGRGVPAARLAVQVLTPQGFRSVQRVTTGSDGAFSARLVASRNRAIRVAQVEARGRRVVSPTVPVTVAPAVTAAAPRRVAAGRRLVVTGTVRPRKPRLVVTAERRRGARGSYVRVARTVVAAGSGRFRASVPLRGAGLHRVRVTFAGDRLNAPSRAPDLVARAVSAAAAARAAR